MSDAAPSYTDCYQILLFAIVCSVLSEALSWLLIYRREDYRRLTSSVEKTTKRLEKEKEVPTKGGKNKALARMEKELQTENRDLAFMKMRASVATGLAHVLAFSYIYNKFDGHAVARLPFEPFGFIRHLSHRNLPGDDYCDCSVVFFYMMCNMGFKPSLQKLLGVAPSGSGPGSMMSLHQQMAAKLNVQ